MLSTLSLLVTILISLISAKDPACCGYRDFSKFPDAQVNFTVDTVIQLNEGWQPFYFGPAGTWAVPSNISSAFYTYTSVSAIIRITDAYETGDRFALYLNGTILGNTSLPGVNSPNYTQYPSEAWLQSNYSRGEWILPPGLHRFTIKVLNSVSKEGSGAFIRLDLNPVVNCGKCRPICSQGPCKCYPERNPYNPPGCCANDASKEYPICKEASGNFFMVKGQFTHDQAIGVCNKLNLRLAEITSANFDGINQFAYVCGGNQVSRSWIRSWNGDDYNNACLVLSSGSFGGTGAINVFPCDTKINVICQA